MTKFIDFKLVHHPLNKTHLLVGIFKEGDEQVIAEFYNPDDVEYFLDICKKLILK